MSAGWKCSAIVVIASVSIAAAQQPPQLVVPLKINEQEATFVSYMIDFEPSTGARSGTANGKVRIRVEPTGHSDHAYRVWVQDQEPREMLPDSAVVVSIERTWPGRPPRALPYEIGYSRGADANGGVQETFYWRSHYRAEGQLEFPGCRALLVVLDLNANGAFGLDERGTSIGLDRNADGRINGREEWLTPRQPIEFCGEVFQVDEVAPDGSSISLSKTELRIPRIGEPLPTLSLTDTIGRQIDFRQWKGKVVVVDFWASWCLPCIAKFAPMQRISQEFADDLVVLSINVDEASDLESARSLIVKHHLTWPIVMRGLANADPLWRTIGSMDDHRMGLPFYVLVDQRGIIRFTTVGANDLSDVRQKISELLRIAKHPD